MASKKADLARVGREGFDLIDQFMDNKAKKTAAAARKQPHVFPGRVCRYEYQPQQSHLYQVKPNEKMNTYEVVQFRDGVTVVDYTAPMFY